MTRKLKYRIGMMALALALLTGCAIENDIPYPTVEAAITAIEVEGKRAAEGETNAAATIDNTARTVTLYVNDSVRSTPRCATTRSGFPSAISPRWTACPPRRTRGWISPAR